MVGGLRSILQLRKGIRFALICATVAFVCALLTPEAHARKKTKWWWSGGRSKKGAYSINLGVRWLAHYNRTETILTAPETYLGEMQLTYWWRGAIGIYGTGGAKVMGAASTYFGIGAKYPFIAFGGKSRAVISGISMNLVFDVGWYSTVPAERPKVYDSSGFLIRYGGSIYWGISQYGFFLDTTMMASKVSDNFFIAPMIGLGYHF